MNNIVISDIFSIYDIFATTGAFRLLFRRRSDLPLPYPERVLSFAQGSFLCGRRALPDRFHTPKPGIPWHPSSDIRVGYFERGSRGGVVVS